LQRVPFCMKSFEGACTTGSQMKCLSSLKMNGTGTIAPKWRFLRPKNENFILRIKGLKFLIILLHLKRLNEAGSDQEMSYFNKTPRYTREYRKIFLTGRLERELQMVQLSATRCSCIAILWVSLVSFAAITLCFASQRVFIVVVFVVYFVIDSVRKLLDTASYYCVRKKTSLMNRSADM
jgi:hypothetical protein